jgi:hypothetical protein
MTGVSRQALRTRQRLRPRDGHGAGPRSGQEEGQDHPDACEASSFHRAVRASQRSGDVQHAGTRADKIASWTTAPYKRPWAARERSSSPGQPVLGRTRGTIFADVDGFHVVLVPATGSPERSAAARIRDAMAAEAVLEALQRRSSGAWERYREALAAQR